MRPILPVALAAILVLAGCGATGTPPTATPTAAPTSTPAASPTPTATTTATATITPTTTPTATPTATPTPTATATPTPAPTPTPRPDELVVTTAEYAEYQTQGTELGFQISSYRTTDYLDGAGDPPEDKQWVVAYISIRNTGSSDARIGWTQYAMTDISGVERAPDRDAMAAESEALAETRPLSAGDSVQAQVIFVSESPDNLTFYIEPWGNSDGPTVVVETG